MTDETLLSRETLEDVDAALQVAEVADRKRAIALARIDDGLRSAGPGDGWPCTKPGRQASQPPGGFGRSVPDDQGLRGVADNTGTLVGHLSGWGDYRIDGGTFVNQGSTGAFDGQTEIINAKVEGQGQWFVMTDPAPGNGGKIEFMQSVGEGQTSIWPRVSVGPPCKSTSPGGSRRTDAGKGRRRCAAVAGRIGQGNVWRRRSHEAQGKREGFTPHRQLRRGKWDQD